MTLAYISHPDCLQHDSGDWHPESPLRLSSISDQLLTSGLNYVIEQFESGRATREQLLRVHTQTYLDHLEHLSKQARVEDEPIHIDDDTVIMKHSLNAAYFAAGAAIEGVDCVMKHHNEVAFCSVRPPGHHAGKDFAMGFCLLNNVAIAAQHAIETYQLKRIAIIDFDVHHGNGTEDIVKNHPNILFCSTFQHPFYPYSGELVESLNVINVPLPAGTKSEAYRQAVMERILPALDAYAPELILISAGFDGHREDEVSQFRLTEQDFAWITQEIKAIANKHCQGKIVSILEGGYNLSALSRSVIAHMKELIGYT